MSFEFITSYRNQIVCTLQDVRLGMNTKYLT